MRKPFTIEFDYPLADNTITLHLHAIAEPGTHSSEFVVHSFSNIAPSRDSLNNHLLPKQTLKCISTNEKRIWVHVESERETFLSTVVGEAIEKIIS